MAKTVGRPVILIPYEGPCDDEGCQDIFLYLRPETNGVEVESTILRQIEHHPHYRKQIRLVYLANIPGDFIVDRHIVEQHYSLKFFFAVHGKSAFTPHMQREFERCFGVSFRDAEILGSFEALKRLHLSTQKLFDYWVPAGRMCIVNGQTIKELGGRYIVNCDIPDLLHKNNRETDIAVMIFRIWFPYRELHRLITSMCDALSREGLLRQGRPANRVFHYSRGPFEQLLDASGYLYDPDGNSVPLDRVSFAAYLMQRGIPEEVIAGAVTCPIMRFDGSSGVKGEDDLYHVTEGTDYGQAHRILLSAERQFLLPRSPV